MGAWAILAFCIVAEVSATSLLTRSEGFAPAHVRPLCTSDLGRLFLGSHAGPVHRVGRRGCNRLEPINQSGLVRD